MRTLALAALAALTLGSLGVSAHAEEAVPAPAAATAAKTSPDEAKAVTLKAAALIAADSVDAVRPKLYAEGEFRHGEIYVNVIDYEGRWVVYPPQPKGEGKVLINVRDEDGMPLVAEIIKLAKTKGEGWIEYRWKNPESGKIQPKVTFVKNVPERGVVVYAGVYK